MPFYSSVHRGTGFKSRLSTEIYERAHKTIGEFVGADLSSNCVIFGKNTTEVINKLSYRVPFADDAVVITSMMEHHSNDLPWRGRAEVVHVAVTPEGRLDEDDLDRLLDMFERIMASDYQGDYQLDVASGEYFPVDYDEPMADFLPLGMHST